MTPQPFEGSPASAAKSAAAEASAASAAATPSRTAAAGPRRRHERLVRVGRHGVHGAGKEDGIEAHVRSRPDVPRWADSARSPETPWPSGSRCPAPWRNGRIFSKVSGGMRFSRSASTRLMNSCKPENLDLGAHALQRLRGHDAREQERR